MKFWPRCFKVLDRRPPWEWGAEKVRIKNSPYVGNRFRPELTPWLKEPLEVLPLNSVTEISCQCCVQGSKTVFILVGSSWAIEFEPDTMIITCQSDDDAKFFARERANYAFERIDSIANRMPTDRSKKSICSISLSDMSLEIQGANPNNLNSKPVRWVFNDEVWLWKRGLLDESRKRATRYWNRRIVNVSTAGEKGCDMDLAFEAGDRREWHLKCPSCNGLNFPKWERIKWPKDPDLIVECPNEKGGTTKEKLKLESGEWNFKAVKYSTFFECEFCKAKHAHTYAVHKTMNDGGAYIATNLNPTPGHVSFRWNALCLAPAELSWGDLAVEWLKAEVEFAKGNEAPRREFIQKRLAESYDPNRYHTFSKLPTVKIEGNVAYDYVFLTVDVQQTEFWAVVRGWSKTGESWLLWAGRLFTWDEIEAKQTEFKVPGQCVFVDAAYEQTRVMRECARHNKLVDINGRKDWVGWKGLDGENQERKSFEYHPENSKPILLPYSWPPKYLSGNSGISAGVAFAKWHLWSNKTVKDILVRLRDGKGSKWLAYDGAPQDWHEQMYSERRIKVYDKFGKESIKWDRIGKRPNHLWDCEAMQVVAACMAQIIGEPIPAKEESVSAAAAN